MICSGCGLEKPDDQFYKHPLIRPDGVRKRCNDCRNKYRREAHLKDPTIKRNQANSWTKTHKARVAELARASRQRDPRRWKGYSLKKDFGITIEYYEDLLIQQDGLCAICRQPEHAKHQNGKLKSLSVDHDHRTGKIRGLLCWHCNTAVGKLKDNVDLLSKAKDYLERHR